MTPVAPEDASHGSLEGTDERLATQPGAATPTGTYIYDDNGQISTRTRDGLTVTFSYDEQHRLAATLDDDPSTPIANAWAYTADGERLIRKTGLTTTLYLDGLELAKAANQPAIGTRYYTTEGATIGLRKDTDEWWRLASNGQNSTQIAIQNQTSAVTQVRYTPYGATRDGGTSLPSDRRFLNGHSEANLGLVHLGARFYDPTLARFQNPDALIAPHDPSTLSSYSYAVNNPTAFMDPTGLAHEPGDGGGCFSCITDPAPEGESPGPPEGPGAEPCYPCPGFYEEVTADLFFDGGDPRPVGSIEQTWCLDMHYGSMTCLLRNETFEDNYPIHGLAIT